jgi:hypothetical protein
MPRAQWPLLANCPRIEVKLTRAAGGQVIVRNLLVDTGAGTSQAGFELLLDERDCLSCGGWPIQPVVLGGAYSGSFPAYLVRVQVPGLAFD